MKIIKVNPRGYCKGVINAINIAKKTASEYPNKKIYILGQLVHNEYIKDSLSLLNIITVEDKEKSRIALLDEIEEESVVIFTAHGVSDIVREKAKKKNLICIDASCSDVIKTKNIVKKYLNDGYKIIYIGKNNHPEAMGIIEDNPNNIYLVNSIDEIEKLHLSPKENLFVTNQTTMSINEVEDIYDFIKNNFKNAIISEEICNATRTRQEAIIKLKDQNVDMLFIVGDKKSNNTKKLKETGIKIGIPKVFLISNCNEINFDEINSNYTIAISSGASTPTYLTNQVIEVLENNITEKQKIDISKIL